MVALVSCIWALTRQSMTDCLDAMIWTYKRTPRGPIMVLPAVFPYTTLNKYDCRILCSRIGLIILLDTPVSLGMDPSFHPSNQLGIMKEGARSAPSFIAYPFHLSCLPSHLPSPPPPCSLSIAVPSVSASNILETRCNIFIPTHLWWRRPT